MQEKFQPLGYPCQNQGPIFFSFPGKIQFIFALFRLFLVGNRTGSHAKGSESKFDIADFTKTIPGQLNGKRF